MNWLLIFVVGFIAVNALIGYKVGFIKTVFSMFSLILAILLTATISPTVNNILKNNENVYSKVREKVEQALEMNNEEIETSQEDTYIEGLFLPKSIRDNLIENKESKVGEFKDYLVTNITDIIIKAIAFSASFVVILIVLWIISFALNIISKLPVLKQINKFTGFFAGLLHGFIIIWLLSILLTVFSGTSFGKEAFIMIEDSEILSLIYDNNLLLGFIINATKLL
ncbi:CvpA family protein [Mobilitalea sibirica]|uniref:CvpA family protein n=1 Tax=Mobilitalea sibirica TaxID=1462919 RepID=A0A8J7GZ84_9FIRM|nr:CvpA family protein [Mobilitalea sibirica]MBH1941124.1 CvpA family protein [Mobilitalea sibirica]